MASNEEKERHTPSNVDFRFPLCSPDDILNSVTSQELTYDTPSQPPQRPSPVVTSFQKNLTSLVQDPTGTKTSISQVASIASLPRVSSSVKIRAPVYHLSSQRSLGSIQNLDSINPEDINRVTPSIRTYHTPHPLPTDAETQAQLAWLGYRQELFRDWNFWSSLSLSCLNIGTIPGSAIGMMTAMTWGGPSVIFWGYLLGMAVMICLSAVIAEMSSAFPAAGAMLTWTFKLARANPQLRDWARFISWLIGTLLFFAHVVIQVALTSQFTSMIISTFIGAGIKWKVEGWQKFLINAVYLIGCGFSVSSSTARSPKLWIILGVFSICLYLILCLTLILTSNAKVKFPDMFNRFENDTDFDSDGFVFLMGWSLVSLAFGAEASAHLAEETKQPASNVPKALFYSTLISYILGCILNVVLSAVSTLPSLEDRSIFKTHLVDLIFAHCPRPAALLILCCLLVLMFLEDVAQLFAASRFTWAMARDRGFPFAHVWRKVSTQHRIPRRATGLLVGCSILAAAVISIKDNIFTESLITSASYLLLICYLVPVAIYLCCDKDVLQYDGRNVWNLRGLSRPCAWISLIFLTFALCLMACPTGLPISAATWSWSPLFLVAVTAWGTTTWMIYGQDRYVGPVKSITLWTTGQEVEFPYKRTTAKLTTQVPKAAETTDIRIHPATVPERIQVSCDEEEEEVRTVPEDPQDVYSTDITSNSSWLGTSLGGTDIGR
ncbi:amino acid permease-domain-containing protein [Melampsora americana]|nr:amino acid permease-domain-containing protein [Melampsora americana]